MHLVLLSIKPWSRGWALTVDPAVAAALPVVQFVLAKPQVDLLLGALHRVAAVDHVPATQRKQRMFLEGLSWRCLGEWAASLWWVYLDNNVRYPVSAHWLIESEYATINIHENKYNSLLTKHRNYRVVCWSHGTTEGKKNSSPFLLESGVVYSGIWHHVL